MSGTGDAGSVHQTRTASDLLSRRIESLVTQWSAVIQRAGRQYGLSGAELEEITQDVRVRLWNLLKREQGGTASVNASYAYRAATSAAIDLVRRDRLTRSASVVGLSDDLTPRAPDDADLLQRLADALQHLQQSRRVAVRLHLDGRSLHDISRMLGWTSAQARNQVYRGLADLKRLLASEGGILP